MSYILKFPNQIFCSYRNNAFKEDEGAWKGEGDGKVVNNQPQRVMMDGQQMMPSGYIGRLIYRRKKNYTKTLCSF